jgi:Na+/melibiose symporter-like transporter
LSAHTGKSWLDRLRDYVRLIAGERAFVRFSLKRLVYMFGSTLAVPLFPLYYVREVEASDAWIGVISTAQSAVLLIGYFYWTRTTRLRGSRYVLLWTTLGMTLYPALVSLTHRVELIALYAGIAGIFQAESTWSSSTS